MDLRCWLLHLLLLQLFAENFSKDSNLDDIDTSLPTFLSRTKLKLHNISVTPKLVKKVITDCDSSKTSSPDSIPVVVLNDLEPEFWYILVELFNMFLKESCFPDCWKVSFVVPIFKNLRKKSTIKNYCLVVFFLWLLKSLKNLQIIVLLITSNNVAFFSNF